MAKNSKSSLYHRVREILESAQASATRSVNSAQVVAYWLIGREIVEEEQKGRKRAGYGEALLEDLALRLTKEFGQGFSARNLRNMRQFHLVYAQLERQVNSLLYERLAKSRDKRGLMRLAKRGQEVG